MNTWVGVGGCIGRSSPSRSRGTFSGPLQTCSWPCRPRHIPSGTTCTASRSGSPLQMSPPGNSITLLAHCVAKESWWPTHAVWKYIPTHLRFFTFSCAYIKPHLPACHPLTCTKLIINWTAWIPGCHFVDLCMHFHGTKSTSVPDVCI